TSYLAPERSSLLANSLHERIQSHQVVTLETVHQAIIQQHQEERREAVRRASRLGFQRIAQEFRGFLPNPSMQYVRDFARRYRISFVDQSTQYNNRAEASYASNVANWFNTIFTEDIAKDVRQRAVLNMNETNINYQMKQKTAKKIGTKRGVSAPREQMPGHITLVATASPGARQPPMFVIFGGLQQVPDYIKDSFIDEDIVFNTSESGFMNRQVYRHYVRILCQWIRKQKQLKYFNEDEKILLFVDGFKSHGDEESCDILSEEGVITIAFPGSLTHLLQPLDSVLFRKFRTAFNKQLQIQRMHYVNQILEVNHSTDRTQITKLSAEQKREMCVRAAIDGFQVAATHHNRQTSFRTCGIWPRSPETAVQRDEVINDLCNPVYQNGRNSGSGQISAQILSKVKRKRVEIEENQMLNTPNEIIPGKKSRRVEEDQSSNESIETIQRKKQIEQKKQKKESKQNEAKLQYSLFLDQAVPISVIAQRPYRRNASERRKSKVEADIVQVQQELELDGMQLINNRGEGNCLFHAINDQLGRPYNNVHQLRLDIINELLTHQDIYQAYFDDQESLQNYARRMSRDGEYGDGALFGAITNLFQVQLEIHMPGGVILREAENFHRILRVAYVGNIHYMSIR
ncbi:MAG: hypothetical protein EZS28_034979, partial [Streblomastix strix]